jgi:mRNA interferase MazF
MKRGEIWWASMDAPRGSEPGYRRPVVITSSNAFNDSRIDTIIVCVVTSNLRLAQAPGNFSVDKKNSGLSRDSVVNISQVITLDKSFLTEEIGRLTDKQLARLDEGLKLVFSL